MQEVFGLMKNLSVHMMEVEEAKAMDMDVAMEAMKALQVVEEEAWLEEGICFNVIIESSRLLLKDVASFVVNVVDIIALTSGKVLKILAFTGVLWSISPQLVFFLFCYSILGKYFTVWFFGAKTMHLNFLMDSPAFLFVHQGSKMEADFRYSLVRICDNAESIAFYRGEKHEASLIQGFFSVLVVNTRELLVWCRHLALFSNAYEYAVIIIPSLIIAPRYFSGEFGVISQTGFAFKSILTAFAEFDRFSGLAAQTECLDGLLEALLEHNSSRLKIKFNEKQSAVVELDSYNDVTSPFLSDVKTPSNHTPLRKVLTCFSCIAVSRLMRCQQRCKCG
ncbi:hypothetical protein L7F22_032694 [Adiantum nelumboides]|nr:hypothetical protein [Adiantum nelumboides]